MKNHQDDILKQFLQDTFSDYEPEPTEQSWENIFSAIQPSKPTFWGKSKPWIVSILVILTSAWLWYSSVKVEANTLANERVKTLATDERTTIQQSDDSQTDSSPDWLRKTQTKAEITSTSGRVKTLATDIKAEVTPTSGRVKTLATDIIKTPKKAEKTQQIEDSQTDSSPDLLGITQTKAEITPTSERVKTLATGIKQTKVEITSTSGRVKTLATDIKAKAEKTQQLDDSQTDFSPNLSAKTKTGITSTSERVKTLTTDIEKETIVNSNTPKVTRGNHPTVENQSDEAVVSRDNLTASTSERMETFITDMNNSNIEKVRYVLPLESIKNKDVTLGKVEVITPSISAIIPPTQKAKPIRKHTYLSLSITPLQTYRILTINNRDVQNVQTNNLFDSERNGWQFEAGIVKPIGRLWNLRADISYLKMRQWSEYQINTDELILRNTNTAQRMNTLEALEQTITESKTLQMVGLKADVQRFFKITGRNRYFISAGTQLMYETNEKQTNIFINASAGFQHVVNKDLFLTVEPTASYLLYNINDSKSLIQTNAYNLGLKVGVNFRVK